MLANDAIVIFEIFSIKKEYGSVFFEGVGNDQIGFSFGILLISRSFS
jgi:hypothetical protein